MELIVETEGLSYAYPDGRRAVAGVDLALREGESVALLGPNGAGKTTVFHLLAGLLKPDGGRLRLFGQVVTVEKDFKPLRPLIGLVFQNPDDQLFTSSVLDDVAFGPLNFGLSQAEAEARAREALDLVGLGGYEDRVPHHLSGGEKRRVCLATVLASHPKLLLLDEPSSNLDPRGRRRLIELLNSIPLTKFIATHDLELALACCQRAVLLDGGRVVVERPIRELLSDGALVENHGLEVPHSLDYHHLPHEHDDHEHDHGHFRWLGAEPGHEHPPGDEHRPANPHESVHVHVHAHVHAHPHQHAHSHGRNPGRDRRPAGCSTWNMGPNLEVRAK